MDELINFKRKNNVIKAFFKSSKMMFISFNSKFCFQIRLVKQSCTFSLHFEVKIKENVYFDPQKGTLHKLIILIKYNIYEYTNN